MTAADQTAGVKQDEVLHKKICSEHNNKEKHGLHAHPHLIHRCKEDPSVFVGPLTWKQSKAELDKLLRQYEVCFNNWKLSGNHGEFKTNPLDKENRNNDSNTNDTKPLPGRTIW